MTMMPSSPVSKTSVMVNGARCGPQRLERQCAGSSGQGRAIFSLTHETPLNVIFAVDSLKTQVSCGPLRRAILDWLTTVLALSSAIFLLRLRITSGWLIAGGAAVGVAARLLGRWGG